MIGSDCTDQTGVLRTACPHRDILFRPCPGWRCARAGRPLLRLPKTVNFLPAAAARVAESRRHTDCLPLLFGEAT